MSAFTFAACVLALVAGALFGWLFAHHMVAAECERLGGFFVGERVFKCALAQQEGK